MQDDYKKYTEHARRGIKGEAYFESLIVEHAIPHRIARQNDLGTDFLCEWIYGDRPTGVLFSVQVKSTTTDSGVPKFVQASHLNGLAEYSLSSADRIDDRIVSYWKGLGLPAYLFQIVQDTSRSSELDCYYKRYTPLLDGHASNDDRTGTKLFYRVNEGAKFLAFADDETEVGGFARDVIVDYVRMQYSKGQVVPLDPGALGFWSFTEKRGRPVVFNEVVSWYWHKIRETCDATSRILNHCRPNEDAEGS